MSKIQIHREEIERATVKTLEDGKHVIEVSRNDGNITSIYQIEGVDYNTLRRFVRVYGYAWVYVELFPRCFIDDPLFDEWVSYGASKPVHSIGDMSQNQTKYESELLEYISSLESQIESLENRAEKAEQLVQMYKRDQEEGNDGHSFDDFASYPIG